MRQEHKYGVGVQNGIGFLPLGLCDDPGELEGMFMNWSRRERASREYRPIKVEYVDGKPIPLPSEEMR